METDDVQSFSYLLISYIVYYFIPSKLINISTHYSLWKIWTKKAGHISQHGYSSLFWQDNGDGCKNFRWANFTFSKQ